MSPSSPEQRPARGTATARPLFGAVLSGVGAALRRRCSGSRWAAAAAGATDRVVVVRAAWVVLGDDRLVVADSGNHRVMIWNAVRAAMVNRLM